LEEVRSNGFISKESIVLLGIESLGEIAKQASESILPSGAPYSVVLVRGCICIYYKK